ncbi:MAG: hypothetical protein WBM32_12740 [Crocosphaera sp.]
MSSSQNNQPSNQSNEQTNSNNQVNTEGKEDKNPIQFEINDTIKIQRNLK